MLALKLFVEDENGVLNQVDLFKDESITLTQSIQDVKDIEKIFTDFSKTFTVPSSKANNKIFQHFYNYNINGFDARVKRNAELLLNDEPFRKGKIKLEGATTKNNKADTYKLTFFGSTVNLKDLIGEDKLDALPFLDNFSFNYTDANIKSYMSDGLDVSVNGVNYQDALLFPLITHTKRLVYDSSETIQNGTTINNIFYKAGNANFGLDISQIKPALRVHTIIKAIEDRYNLEFSKDFFNEGNIPYYNLYLWLHHKTGGLFVDEESSTRFGTFVQDSGKDQVITLNRNNFQSPHIGATDDNARFFDFTIVPPNQITEFSIYIKKDGQPYESFEKQTADSTGEFHKKEIELEAGNYTIEVESESASTFGFRGFVMRQRKASKRDVHWTGTATTIVGNTINASKKLPEIKVLTFLTGIFKLFNLTSFQNNQGEIVVKTLDSYYENNAKTWDVTKFIDKTEQTVDSVLPFKQIDFDYKGTKTFLAENYQQRNHIKWGSLNKKPDKKDKVEGSIYKIEVPFEHMMFERLDDSNASVSTPTNIQYGWSADIKQEPTLGEPLLFYPIKQTGVSFGVIDSSNAVSQKTSFYLPSNSYLLTDSNNINFNAEVNEFTRLSANSGLVFTKTLFNEYYKKYITEVFDKGRRLTTTKAYLPINITRDMNLSDKLKISDRLYKINKIVTNFETNQSTLELINTTNVEGGLILVEANVKQRYDNTAKCITVDSNAITVDSIKEDASMTCDSVLDGQILDNPKTNQSSDALSPNNPSSGDVANTIPVTKPIISKISNKTTFQTGTTYKLEAKWQIDTLGKINQTKNVDEYGFVFSNDINTLASADVDILKANVSNVVLAYPTNAMNNKPKEPTLISGHQQVVAPNILYYRFYARTNIRPEYILADAVSDVERIEVSTYCNEFYRFVNFSTFDEAVTITAIKQDGSTHTLNISANASGGTGNAICLDSITSTGPIQIRMEHAVKI
jgi:hypothetical protein